VIGYLSAPHEPDFQVNRFLLRPIYLLVLGYLIAYWHAVKLKRRLQFLKDINKFSSPRFGIERTMNRAMERLRSFYDPAGARVRQNVRFPENALSPAKWVVCCGTCAP